MDDPFSTPAGAAYANATANASANANAARESHRYSTFDTQLLSLNASSPAQLKRALEAHLSETERRLQEASKIGTTLVNQQKELTDKLEEVEQQQKEGEIGPDLRQRLVELERECNDIGRETTRAALGPKSRHVATDEPGTPSLEGRVSRAFTIVAVG